MRNAAFIGEIIDGIAPLLPQNREGQGEIKLILMWNSGLEKYSLMSELGTWSAII